MIKHDENFNQQIVDMYNSGKTVLYITNILKCSKSYVYKLLHLKNVKFQHDWDTRHVRFLECDVDNMYSLYQKGSTLKDVGKVYNIGPKRVGELFKQYGYNTRNVSDAHKKYKINEDFFDAINTQEKAYCLGLLYADGTNITKRNSISIGLQERDKELLEKVRSAIGIDKPLYFEKNNKEYGQNIYRLNIVNKHMSKVLNNIGMVQNKSLILTFPTCIPDELMHHFIRGYVDGDGYISRGRDYTAEIMGTESFCLSIQKILLRCGIDSQIYNTTLHKETSTRRLYIGRKENFKKFIDYIYTDATIYLDRKYLIAMSKLNNIDNSLSD